MKINALPTTQFEPAGRPFGSPSSRQGRALGEYDVVVVGGGVSGLTAAWKIQNRSVLLLDQGTELGGNARTEYRNGLRFAIGGTCFQLPTNDGEVATLLRDLDLWNTWRVAGDADMLAIFDTRRLLGSMDEVVMGLLKRPAALLNPGIYGLTVNLIYSAIARRKLIAASKKLGDPTFAALFAYLDRFKPGSDRYPALPWREDGRWRRQDMEQLDSISLHELLFDQDARARLPRSLAPTGRFGKLVEDAVETTLRAECLSAREVSGYVGLYFLIGYLYGSLVSFPGGNGLITERLQERLGCRSQCALKKNARVDAVQHDGARYQIYFEQDGQRLTVSAGSVIWAAPKFSALQAIDDLPAGQRQAIGQIEHRDYCMANVFLEKAAAKKYFGGYLIETHVTGKYPNDWCRSGACLVANWMDSACTDDIGVLTLLKPVAREADQGKLTLSTFDDLQRSTYLEACELLQAMGIATDLIQDIKIWRWPRSLVIAKRGQMKDDVFVRASHPHRGIFFANQDSIGIGNLESAIAAGCSAAAQAEEHMTRESGHIPLQQGVDSEQLIP
ncbi:MAG: NAD(P)-binding protein [Gammaproteobacteria bacterium]|nr:NAD(P)-binding protein [Gammaproteobacteria bacterium]